MARLVTTGLSHPSASILTVIELHLLSLKQRAEWQVGVTYVQLLLGQHTAMAALASWRQAEGSAHAVTPAKPYPSWPPIAT